MDTLSSAPDPLCDRCRSIDFEEILSRPYPHHELVVLVSLERLPPSGCVLCELFSQYCGDQWGEGLLCSVPWVSTVEDVRILSGDADPRVLGILPTRHVDSLSDFFGERGYLTEPVDEETEREGKKKSCQLIGTRLVHPRAIPYPELQKCLDGCVGVHGRRPDCVPLETDPSWPIRLIDCQTRRIVAASSLASPRPPFVALSYVWGQMRDRQLEQLDYDQPLPPLPLTIEDSMTVTRELGLRYLWVDRYCIRQTDERDKQIQVRLMGEIYGSARLTIFAAAGSDPSYGLPGVSQRPRRPQPRARLSATRTLTWTLGSARGDLDSSVWSTRGWTYQEAMLSTRCLVFTDSQVYFQCGLTTYHEANNLALTEAGFVNQPRLIPLIQYAKLDAEVADMVAAFSSRQLGQETDVLHAIRGVLSRVAQVGKRHAYFWGIPVIKSFASRPTSPYFVDYFLAGLCWRLARPGERRRGFPSWSWAGWKGPVHPDYAEMLRRRIGANNWKTAVALEAPDGSKVTWSRLEPALRAGSVHHEQCATLVLTSPHAFSFPVEDAACPAAAADEDGTTELTVGGWRGRFSPLSTTTRAGQLSQRPLWGVPIRLASDVPRSSAEKLLLALVLEKTGEQVWERVGLFAWTHAQQSEEIDSILDSLATSSQSFRVA